MKQDNSQILLISVKPKFAVKIMSGEKTVELRKSAPINIKKGNVILLYVTSPVKELWGFCQIECIIKDNPTDLWKKVKKTAGISEKEFFEYFKNYENGYGLVMKNIQNIEPIELENLKLSINGFYPPQTYCYIDKKDLIKSRLNMVLTSN